MIKVRTLSILLAITVFMSCGGIAFADSPNVSQNAEWFYTEVASYQDINWNEAKSNEVFIFPNDENEKKIRDIAIDCDTIYPVYSWDLATQGWQTCIGFTNPSSSRTKLYTPYRYYGFAKNPIKISNWDSSHELWAGFNDSTGNIIVPAGKSAATNYGTSSSKTEWYVNFLSGYANGTYCMDFNLAIGS